MIKLEKAIETLNLKAALLYQPKDKDYHDSLRLGSEALKAVVESRRLWGDRGVGTLPGETEGEEKP